MVWLLLFTVTAPMATGFCPYRRTAMSRSVAAMSTRESGPGEEKGGEVADPMVVEMGVLSANGDFYSAFRAMDLKKMVRGANII